MMPNPCFASAKFTQPTSNETLNAPNIDNSLCPFLLEFDPWFRRIRAKQFVAVITLLALRHAPTALGLKSIRKAISYAI